MASNQSCCCGSREEKKKEATGFWSGVLYGLLPHTFCIGFIVFSVLGVTLAAGVMRQLLLIPQFFTILVILTVVLATVSAVIYLGRNGLLSLAGAKAKWRYLSVLYGTTIAVNLLLFNVVFPAAANANSTVSAAGEPAAVQQTTASSSIAASGAASVTLAVNIPCPGHALLIAGELKKVPGVKNVTYKFPNLFTVRYDPARTSIGKIVSLEVFQTYKASIGGS